MPKETRIYKYLFGPVSSRRLGLSLGVDLVPLKVCSFDCIYCQLGRTTHKTVERREWAPTADVIAEIEDWVGAGGQADVVTLAGSGEPTLHTGFGRVLDAVRRLTPIRTALLTNGSLLYLPEVREGAARADIVKVTLCASNESLWSRIHRQAAELRFAQTLEGLKTFRKMFRGELWLEVMVLGGINAPEGEVRRIAALSAAIGPDRVHLNTPVRPPAEDFVIPVGKDELERLARLFSPPAEAVGSSTEAASAATDAAGSRTEVAGEPHPKAHAGSSSQQDDAIVAMLRRHPCSAAEIAAASRIPLATVRSTLKRLARRGLVRTRKAGTETSYVAVSSAPD